MWKEKKKMKKKYHLLVSVFKIFKILDENLIILDEN